MRPAERDRSPVEIQVRVSRPKDDFRRPAAPGLQEMPQPLLSPEEQKLEVSRPRVDLSALHPHVRAENIAFNLFQEDAKKTGKHDRVVHG